MKNNRKYVTMYNAVREQGIKQALAKMGVDINSEEARKYRAKMPIARVDMDRSIASMVEIDQDLATKQLTDCVDGHKFTLGYAVQKDRFLAYHQRMPDSNEARFLVESEFDKERTPRDSIEIVDNLGGC